MVARRKGIRILNHWPPSHHSDVYSYIPSYSMSTRLSPIKCLGSIPWTIGKFSTNRIKSREMSLFSLVPVMIITSLFCLAAMVLAMPLPTDAIKRNNIHFDSLVTRGNHTWSSSHGVSKIPVGIHRINDSEGGDSEPVTKRDEASSSEGDNSTLPFVDDFKSTPGSDIKLFVPPSSTESTGPYQKEPETSNSALGNNQKRHLQTRDLLSEDRYNLVSKDTTIV